jgi:tetratricopeptide (TPR) repeat protein
VALLLAPAATSARAQSTPAVRAWEGELALPTTVEGPANPNPPFDQFALGRFNYPYALRDAVTDQERVERYRALFLENEFLKVTVLPELGGHLYSCLDKTSGRQMFYANPSIKKALIGYRGAWAAFGIEFNFPVSHNWMSVSPVNSAIVSNADGSASIWVGNVDEVFGSEWRVELRLRPGRAVLEQHTTLVNQSDTRHRYYWWTNAAVQVDDDSRLIYPTHLMATHGFTAIEPWPIDAKGRDLSVIKNQADGPVSLFTYGTREPFMSVWHPSSRSGTVHVSAVSELPTDKVWSWGFDQAALGWRKALSDNQSAYIELQAGLFRNQETYALLEPQEEVHFSEYWLPARDIGGITRATVDAVLNAQPREGGVALELNVTRAIPDARIRVRQGDRALLDRAAALSLSETWRQDLDVPMGPAAWTFELSDEAGKLLLSHTADRLDALTPTDVAPGPQAGHRYPAANARTEGDIIEIGHDQELNGRRLDALSTYRDGLEKFPRSATLRKAAGRLATSLHWAEAGTPLPAQWLGEALSRDTTDMETRYYLGMAQAASGQTRDATIQFEAAQRFHRTRVPALLQLARLAARGNDMDGALAWLAQLTEAAPRDALAGGVEVACLRRAKRLDKARSRLDYWRGVDPTSTMLRYEAHRLGGADVELWRQLAANSNRVLDLVDQYLALGRFEDALELLNYEYAVIAPPASEPGAVPPARDPLIAYYRGYVRTRLGQAASEDFHKGAALPLTYVFPHRPTSYAVLRTALQANPNDGHAVFLLGTLLFSDGLVDEAIDSWTRARKMAPEIPTLGRNLGLALLRAGRIDEAVDVLKEAIRYDGRNVEVYLTLDQALSARQAPAPERAAALEQYPDQADMPAALVYKLAIARAESGQDVTALFRGRYFPAEEGGTSPERALAIARVVGAHAAASTGRCETALTLVDDASAPDSPIAADAVMQLQLARVEATCGRRDAAGRRWTKAARETGADASPSQVSTAYEAARAMGGATDAQWTPRLEAALGAADAMVDAGDSNLPAALYTQARLRAALGRMDQARESLTRMFLVPDVHLSHALARLLQRELTEGSR